MTTFRYRAVKDDGSSLTGELEAGDRRDAVAALRKVVIPPPRCLREALLQSW